MYPKEIEVQQGTLYQHFSGSICYIMGVTEVMDTSRHGVVVHELEEEQICITFPLTDFNEEVPSGAMNVTGQKLIMEPYEPKIHYTTRE